MDPFDELRKAYDNEVIKRRGAVLNCQVLEERLQQANDRLAQQEKDFEIMLDKLMDGEGRMRMRIRELESTLGSN